MHDGEEARRRYPPSQLIWVVQSPEPQKNIIEWPRIAFVEQYIFDVNFTWTRRSCARKQVSHGIGISKHLEARQIASSHFRNGYSSPSFTFNFINANMSDDDYVIETTDAGASATIPMEAGQIKKGGYVKLGIEGLQELINLALYARSARPLPHNLLFHCIFNWNWSNAFWRGMDVKSCSTWWLTFPF